MPGLRREDAKHSRYVIEKEWISKEIGWLIKKEIYLFAGDVALLAWDNRGQDHRFRQTKYDMQSKDSQKILWVELEFWFIWNWKVVIDIAA